VAKSGFVAFFIALFLQGVWSTLIGVNFATSPEIPWSVPVIVILVWLACQYLGGKWIPRSTSEARRSYLRARAIPARLFAWALLAGALSIVALAGCWIVMTRFVRMPANVLPDMSQYPWLTTVLIVVTGSLIGPVMEQAGFWSYGQVILEREFRPSVAILILSVLFAVGPHPPMGSPLWPKFVFYFLTSVMFGAMALFTNSILPGLVVHIIGDLTFFTVVWPHDPARPLIVESGTDAWLWLRVAQTIMFTTLAVLAFAHLARVARPMRAAAG